MTYKAPNYYSFGPIEALDISRHLTGNGAQAMQYIVRACRLDGEYKHDPIDDLNKAMVFIADEIARLEGN